MRKLFSFFAFILFAAIGTSCDDKPVPTPDEPTNGVKPEITLTEVGVEAESFTFNIVANTPCEYGYYLANDLESEQRPDITTWFELNGGHVEDSIDVTIEGLSQNTPYTLYVVAKSSADGSLSAVKTLKFTTLDDGKFKPIEILEVGTNYFTFKINFEGYYVFLPFEQAYLPIFGSAANYLVQKNIFGSGVQTIKWENGGSYGNEPMNVQPNMTYVIAVAECGADGIIVDAEGNLLSEVHTIEVTTKALSESNANVEITLSNITSTSVDIKAVPDDTVSTFYLFVQESATFESNMEMYGEGAYMSVMKSHYAWSSTMTIERTWEGLTPSTKHVLLKLVVDRAGGESFSWQEFTTAEATGAPAELTAELVAAAKDPYKTLELKIKTNGVWVKYAFNTTVDVDMERAKGMTDDDVASYRGAELTPEQLAEATSTGLTLPLEDLWPETEYTAIVKVVNNEKTATVKAVTFTTSAQPLPTRVESELFTSLVGEWEVSYSYRDIVGDSRSIDGAKVRIAAGVDDYTNKHYRDLNRLVILDWPFQAHWASYDYTTNEPKHLAANNDYWKNNPNLAYRDYGPKIFLEIGEGDVISVPTSKNMYFYNERPNGGDLLHFYGTDLSKEQNAPCAFPVTLSADGNTLTIGACHSGAEYFYGVYRPAIWRDQELHNVATTDIVLRRVK